ncbi:13880_t:CDS:2, partial [Funneliformis mosseae]
MSVATSSATGNEKVSAICQEIARLNLNLNEESFSTTERVKLRAFFIKNSNNINFVSEALDTIPPDNYNERLALLKELSSDTSIEGITHDFEQLKFSEGTSDTIKSFSDILSGILIITEENSIQIKKNSDQIKELVQIARNREAVLGEYELEGTDSDAR